MPVRIVAYMTGWCPDCTRSRRVLVRSGLPFEEIDIDHMTGAEDIMRGLNGGSGKVPTIIIESEQGQTVLIEPTDRELSEALRKAQPS